MAVLFFYAENENVTSEVEEDGSTTSYTYNGDEAGEVLDDLPKTMKEVDGDGTVLYNDTYEYDEFGNVTSVYDSVNDITILTEYYTEDDPESGHIKGEVKSEQEILGTAENGEVQSSTSYTYRYDGSGNKTEIVMETCDGITTTTTTVTDVLGRTLHEEDSNQKQTDYVYDGFGRLIRTTYTYSDGATDVIEKTYNDNGALTWERQQDGTENSYSYDSMNRVVSETTVKGSLSKTWSTSYGYQSVSYYDGTGMKEVPHAFVTTEKNPDGEIIGQTFQDSLGRTVREKSSGIYVDMSYDSQDHVVTKCEVGQQAGPQDQLLILYLYDANGNQTHTIQNPSYDVAEKAFYVTDDSIVNASVYDTSGQVISQTDAEGNTVEFAYDNQGNLTKVTLPGDNVTTYAYDVENEDGTTSDITTDALGRTTESRSNARMLTELSIAYGDGTVAPISVSSEYDPEDRLVKETESAGNYRTYEYDSRDRKTAVNSFDASGTQTLRTVYTYDKRDNVTSMADYQYADGEAVLYHYTKYTYDDLNRQTGYAEWNGSAIPTQDQLADVTVTYTYDIDGNVTSAAYPESAGSSIRKLTYTYNTDKWLTQIHAVTADGTSHLLREYTYNTNGQLTAIKDDRNILSESSTGTDHTICSFTYDRFERVIKIAYTEGDSSEEKESYEYTYDKNNNILTETIVNHYPASEEDWVEEQRCYTYDALGRLTSTGITDKLNGTSKTTEYTYDQVGNRLTEEEDGIVTTYTYNSLNQLLSTEQKDEDGNVTESTAYQYDGNGNQTAQTITPSEGTAASITLSYDAENRLSQYVKKEGDTITLTQTNRYNGSGQRIQKVEGDGIIHYFYDVDTVLYTTDELGDLTAVNHMGTQNNVICTSRFGENESGEDGTGEDGAYESKTEALYYYTKDIRESTTNLLDSTGSGVVSYQYTDFGETSIHGDETFYNEVCFTGGIYDEGTGLYYLNARYYNPEDGRFLTQDTYTGENTDPESLHLYAYCTNNPVTNADPSGHIAISRIVGAAVGGVAAGYASYKYAKKKGIKGWKRTALVAGCAVGGAAAGALIGPKVAKVAKKAARVVKKKATKVYKKAVKKATKKKPKVTKSRKKACSTQKRVKCKRNTKRRGDGCFTAHTMIITKDGKKEIQDIQTGEEVLSADSYTGEVSYKKVLKTVCLEVETLVYVSVNGERIETTTEHPFWVEGVGFVPAYALKKGDALRLDDGSDVSIECVEIQHLDEPVKVYNFTVEDNHTYYVGDSGVLVHNAKCGETTRVRHYTNSKGLEGIQKSGKILAKDNNRVYLEPAKKKALSSTKAEELYQLKKGRGKHYVEFDVDSSLLEWVENPRYHRMELTVKGDIKITNAKFFRRK